MQSRRSNISNAEARAAAREVQWAGKLLAHYFERYIESISEIGVADEHESLAIEIYKVQALTDYLRDAGNEALRSLNKQGQASSLTDAALVAAQASSAPGAPLVEPQQNFEGSLGNGGLLRWPAP